MQCSVMWLEHMTCEIDMQWVVGGGDFFTFRGSSALGSRGEDSPQTPIYHLEDCCGVGGIIFLYGLISHMPF